MPEAIAAAASWVASAATAAAAEAGVTSLVAAKVIYAAAYAATYATISYGATSAVSALTKPKVSSQGTQTDVQLDPQAPIPFVLGRTKVGGKVAYTTTVGEKNKYLLFYRTLAGGAPNEGFETFEANNTAITFGTDSGEGASGVFQNRLWMKRSLDGGADYAGLRFTATGTKDTPADHGGNPSEWTAAHRLSGYMCSLMAVEFDATKFSGGPPKPGDVIKGARVYDPRLDSTYPGGSGPQRWADPADTAAFAAAWPTWTWSENPYLLGLAWVLGRWTRDEADLAAVYRRTLGVGAPIDKVIVEQFVEGANVADANGWTAGGEVTSADGKWDTLATILQAGGGEPMRLGAKIGCFVNMPRVSIATLTGDDLADGEITIPATASRRDRINRVYPRYRSEAHDWEIVTGGPIEVSAYVTADGGWRSREVDFPLVQDVDQASQLAALHIVNQREFGPGTLSLKPRWLGLKPGDCVTLDIPAANLTSERVLIKARQLDPSTAARTISFVSETDAKHDYVLGRTGTAPPIPSLTASDLTPATPDEADWSVTGGVQSGPGGTLPVIVLTGVLRDPHSVAVIVDYRQVLMPSPGATYGPWASREWPTSSLTLNSDGDPEVTLELTGLAPGATYQVRVRYRTIRGVEDPTVNLDLGEVDLGGLAAGSVGGLQAGELRGIIEAIGGPGTAALAERTRARIAEIFAAADLSAEAIIRQAMTSVDDRLYQEALSHLDGVPLGVVVREEQIRTDDTITSVTVMSARVTTAEAAIVIEQTARASADSAEAALRVTLASRVATAEAAIVTEQTTRASADSAEAALRVTLASRVATAEAAIVTEQTTRASADSALTSVTNAQASRLGAAEATIVSNYSTLATADAALTSTTTSQGSRLGTAEAAIVSNYTTLATADSALAGRATNIEAQLANTAGSGLSARITTEEGVRLSNDNALAGRAETLEAQLNNTVGSALQSRIQTEESARVTAVGAVADSLSTLITTVNGHTSSLTTQGGTLATLSGRLEAYLKFIAQAGAEEARVEIVAANDSGSLISMVAKRIRLGSSAITALEVDDGLVRIKNCIMDAAQIQDLTIGTSAHKINNISEFSSVSPIGSVAMTASDQVVATLTRTVVGQVRAELIVSYSNSGSTAGCSVDLYIDGAGPQNAMAFVALAGASEQKSSFGYYNLSPGSHVFQLRARGGTSVTLFGVNLGVDDRKTSA